MYEYAYHVHVCDVPKSLALFEIQGPVTQVHPVIQSVGIACVSLE